MQSGSIHKKNLLPSLWVRARDKLDVLRAQLQATADISSRFPSCCFNELHNQINFRANSTEPSRRTLDLPAPAGPITLQEAIQYKRSSVVYEEYDAQNDNVLALHLDQRGAH